LKPDQLQLMHEVLDGEASAEDARQLDRLLATDPEARAEYEALRCLFDGLNAMPKAVPPQGMIAETLARIPSRPRRPHRLRQLSSRWRVFVSDSTRLREKSPIRGARTQRNFQGEHNRNANMNKGTLLIGVGVAAVAVIAAAYHFDFPPSGDMSGTIAPAVRSVAAQPGAADMTVASQGDVVPAPVVNDDASRDSMRDGAKDSMRDGAKDSMMRDGAKDSMIRDGAKDSMMRDGAKDSMMRDGAKDSMMIRDGAKDSMRDGASPQ
jgi:anti-sigma factor RsiW